MRPPPDSRRELAVAVLVCAVASAATLFAGTRGWGTSDGGVAGPAGAPTSQTGRSLVPWLPALAMVSLAGSGALVALRSAARTVLGWLLGACGCGIAVTAGFAVADGARPLWPVATCGFGLAIGWVGWRAVRRAAAWPAMGGRFERPAERATGLAERATGFDERATGFDERSVRSEERTVGSEEGTVGSEERAVGFAERATGRDDRQEANEKEIWDALDRGEDPTR